MLQSLNHITIAVSDVEKSLEFYTQVLGLVPHVRWEGGAYLSIDTVWLCLSSDTVSPSQDYSHIAFSVSEDSFGDAVLKLKAENVSEWKQNSSEGHSFYFLDPDGNKLEIHTGTLESRLNSLRKKPYKGLVWL